jgi:L-amino acid N-acyltransferase YncA
VGVQIRLGFASDADGVQAIYAVVVRSTAVSFELDPPAVEEMAARIVDRQPMLPWLVAEDDRGVAGYCYAGRFSGRPAYDWSVETSVYVAERARGRAVGSGLYVALLDILVAQGYRQVMAGVALPNEASVRLHEKVGFVPVGVYRAVGWKFGRWHDVGWWQRSLGAGDRSAPGTLRALDRLPAGLLSAACDRGSTLVDSSA